MKGAIHEKFDFRSVIHAVYALGMYRVARSYWLRGCNSLASPGNSRAGGRPILLSERLLLLLPEQQLALLAVEERTLDGTAEITLAERDQTQGQGQ